MTIENIKLVNCGNDFYENFFNKVCDLLESGAAARIYVDCIGHTRNNTVQEIYKEKLVEKYGDNIIVEYEQGGYSHSYSYQLVQ